MDRPLKKIKIKPCQLFQQPRGVNSLFQVRNIWDPNLKKKKKKKKIRDLVSWDVISFRTWISLELVALDLFAGSGDGRAFLRSATLLQQFLDLVSEARNLSLLVQVRLDLMLCFFSNRFCSCSRVCVCVCFFSLFGFPDLLQKRLVLEDFYYSQFVVLVVLHRQLQLFCLHHGSYVSHQESLFWGDFSALLPRRR